MQRRPPEEEDGAEHKRTEPEAKNLSRSGWWAGPRTRGAQVVRYATMNPQSAVEWTNEVVQRLPDATVREQRNAAILLRMMRVRFSAATIELAESRVMDPFARATMKSMILTEIPKVAHPGAPTSEKRLLEREPTCSLDEPAAKLKRHATVQSTTAGRPDGPVVMAGPDPIPELEGARSTSGNGRASPSGTASMTAPGAAKTGAEDVPPTISWVQRGAAPTCPTDGDQLDSSEKHLLDTLRQWGKQTEMPSRIDSPPLDGVRAMMATAQPEIWAQMTSQEQLWSDSSLAILVEKLVDGEGMSLRLATAIAKHSIVPRLMKLDASATRELMIATLQLSSAFPRITVNTIFPDSLPHLSVAIAEVLARVARGMTDAAMAVVALEQTCRIRWIEATIKVVEELVTKCVGQEKAIQLVVAGMDRNAPYLSGSIRFAKLAMLLLNKSKKEHMRPHYETLRSAMVRCDSFLAKSIVKKLIR